MKLNQSLFLFVLSVFVFLVIAPANAQTIPFGVSPKEIVESGMVQELEQQTFGVDKAGNLLRSYDYKVGNRTGVELEGVEYTLRFWNVGKMGGTSGWLFWKKDYGKAVLTLTPVASKPGFIVSDKVDNSKFGLPDGWKIDPATSDPNFRSVSCQLVFSGGPSGEFAGICNEGETVKGRLVNGRNFVFTEVKDAERQETLYIVQRKQFPINENAFSDWKIDDAECVDSGTRFNSISGTVEVASDAAAKENKWGFARLETILCVDDHVKTGEESEAILSFADMSTFVMAPETEIIINSPPRQDSKWNLVLGKIKANIKKMAKDGTMEIEMSQAVAGIKGTRFVLSENGSESKIEVTEGVVAFRSKADGQEVLVSAGEAIAAATSGFTEKTAFDPAALDSQIIQEAQFADSSLVQSAQAQAVNNLDNKAKEKANKIIYGALIVILITIIGGAWATKMRKK